MTEPPQGIAEHLPAARAGSQEALGEILEACRRYLLGIANREFDAGLRAKGNPSDLVQETFLEAQRDFPNFRGTTETELFTWLRRILLHNLANFIRRYRQTTKRQIDREVLLTPPDSASIPGRAAIQLAAGTPTPSQQMMAGEEARELHEAIDRLPDDYRQVLRLRYLDDRSFEEIGQIMRRSANAVRLLWGRAVERLQRELEPEP
jgi:RNA polymerase sigma-70 factor (ECF subfamily)